MAETLMGNYDCELQTNSHNCTQNKTLLVDSCKLSPFSFNRDLSSNAITFLPERVFDNLKNLKKL